MLPMLRTIGSAVVFGIVCIVWIAIFGFVLGSIGDAIAKSLGAVVVAAGIAVIVAGLVVAVRAHKGYHAGLVLVILGLALPLAAFPFSEPAGQEGARASLVEQVRHYQVPLWGKTCRTVETPLPLPPGVNPKSLRALAPGYETTTRCEPRGIPFRYVSAAGIISIALGSWFVIVSRSQRGQ